MPGCKETFLEITDVGVWECWELVGLEWHAVSNPQLYWIAVGDDRAVTLDDFDDVELVTRRQSTSI